MTEEDLSGTTTLSVPGVSTTITSLAVQLNDEETKATSTNNGPLLDASTVVPLMSTATVMDQDVELIQNHHTHETTGTITDTTKSMKLSEEPLPETASTNAGTPAIYSTALLDQETEETQDHQETTKAPPMTTTTIDTKSVIQNDEPPMEMTPSLPEKVTVLGFNSSKVTIIQPNTPPWTRDDKTTLPVAAETYENRNPMNTASSDSSSVETYAMPNVMPNRTPPAGFDPSRITPASNTFEIPRDGSFGAIDVSHVTYAGGDTGNRMGTMTTRNDFSRGPSNQDEGKSLATSLTTSGRGVVSGLCVLMVLRGLLYH